MQLLSIEEIGSMLAGTSALLAVIVTVVIFIISSHHENKMKLMDKFNELYHKTFDLRNEISTAYKLELNNEEFYYEIDNILDNQNILIKVLDYLNEIENLFLIVNGKLHLYKTFKTLMSYALYARLAAFYGLIIKLQKNEGDYKKFSNYLTVINRVEKMKKIKMHKIKKTNRYYIGIRYSDQSYSGKYFCKSITMFSDDNCLQCSLRPNQNIDMKNFIPYVKNHMEKILNNKCKRKATDKCKFMFYNPLIAYRLPNEYIKNVMCLNDENLLNFLNDKILCKNWLMNSGVPIIPFKTVFSEEIKNSKPEKLFADGKKYVVQDNHGGGGIGTFLLEKENFEIIKTKLIPLKQYICSPYLENSVSVNVHIFISEKQTVLSPASVQIIELKNHQLCYRGADFFAFKNISETCKQQIKKLSLKIANLLRNKNYRGIAGIDFIVSKDNTVYFAEINPRFQASTLLIDLYLNKNSANSNANLAKSVFELNEQAFNNNIKSDLCFEDPINFSCYYYYNDGIDEKYFKMKKERFKQEKVQLDLDGLKFENNTQFNDNSYMFRAVFTHPISVISPDNELWISDNIVISSKPKNIFDLKIALLNQGVKLVNKNKNIKKGVYESIDIKFSSEYYNVSELDINCAIGINLSQYSPFELDCERNILRYFDEIVGNAEVEKDLLANLSEPYNKILYLATDRLRIKLISGCEYKNLGKGCLFCNVPISEKNFTFEEIKKSLNVLKTINPTFRHILIGGGTYLGSDVWDKIINLLNYLKNDEYFKNKPISLMTVLPPANMLQKLKDAGISEVAFNLEIADRETAKQYMVGKLYDKDYFYITMKTAVNIFGINNVRSALIVGLNKTSDLVNEALTMARAGILPCLSAYRVLPGTNSAINIPPTNSYLRKAYDECASVIKTQGCLINELGPLCKHCQNNMLII